MKTLKLSKYFKIVKPEYVYLKLIPNNSIRNYDSNKIAKAISSLYRNIVNRIERYERQFFFNAPSKVSYYIYIERTKVDFYFIIPKAHLNLIKEKIGDTWKGITINVVDSIPEFSDEAIKYKLNYKKEDALSLAVDRRTNTLLAAALNVIDVMEEGDKVGIFYNFIPSSQFTWKAEYDRTMQKIKDNRPIDREKMSFKYAGKVVLSIIFEVMNMITDIAGDVFGANKQEHKDLSLLELAATKLNKKELSQATIIKKDKTIIDTQIILLSESKDRIRKKNNTYSVCQSYKSITDDNELVYKRFKESVNFKSFRISKVESIKASADECQNFLALPGRELLEEHKIIEKIDTFESEVPKELKEGIMCIGENTYRGKKQKAFLTNDKEFKYLTLTIIGPTRAGKSTLISNLSNDGLSNKECVILFDFCGNNELSNEVSEKFSAEKILNIDCNDFDNLQGLGYNEVKNTDDNVFKVYRNAKVQTSQLLTLVNSINADDKSLTAKMDRYLESAALIVFISGGPIKDVFATLQNHLVRQEYIDNIPENQKGNLEEYVLSLKELDEESKVREETVDKEGNKTKVEKIVITGTRLNKVAGIIDRINKLKQNTYMELMLKKDCKNNIDLVQEIQENQLICIRMPENMFSTETEKDIYCTYWITKLWLALQIRKWQIADRDQHVKVNIFVDELYQVPNTQDFIRSKLSQMAKFSAKMIISCHYLGQIPIIRNELKAANSSYMLISGCDKDNYRELKDELYPYTVEDLLNLKRYHSLNLIKYENGYAKFITVLPKPI